MLKSILVRSSNFIVIPIGIYSFYFNHFICRNDFIRHKTFSVFLYFV